MKTSENSTLQTYTSILIIVKVKPNKSIFFKAHCEAGQKQDISNSRNGKGKASMN